MIKICLNCGDKLLEQAKKCPTCGTKDSDFPLVDKNDKARINEITSNVPCPKENQKPKWQNKLEHTEKKFEKISWTNISDKRTDREKQLDSEGVAYCPKCKSTSLTAHKKGFGIGKAVVGAALTGGIGLVAGNINAKKVRVTCLKCGNQFWAGKK